jgi:shikimate kinase
MHRDGAPGAVMRSITLIGMPGSGKSAVGRIIASQLGWELIDTDKLLEKRHGMPLQALIDKVGDDSFRRLEEEAVLRLPAEGQGVISTGGSVIYSEAAMRHLLQISYVVFLDASLDSIRRHIAAEAPRGIIGMKNGSLEKLYRARLPLYRYFSTVSVQLDTQTPEEIAEMVLSELQTEIRID